MEDGAPALAPEAVQVGLAPKPDRVAWFHFCLLVAFSPWLLLLASLPVLWALDCGGGSSVHCARAPWFSETAGSIFGIGAWGIFFTFPTGVVLFVGRLLIPGSFTRHK